MKPEVRTVMEDLVEACEQTLDHTEGTCFECDWKRLEAQVIRDILREADAGTLRQEVVVEWMTRMHLAGADLRNRIYPEDGTPLPQGSPDGLYGVGHS